MPKLSNEDFPGCHLDLHSGKRSTPYLSTCQAAGAVKVVSTLRAPKPFSTLKVSLEIELGNAILYFSLQSASPPSFKIAINS